MPIPDDGSTIVELSSGFFYKKYRERFTKKQLDRLAYTNYNSNGLVYANLYCGSKKNRYGL